MEFVSANLPLILCAVVGLILMIVEAFIPGFGVAGISGIVLEVIAVCLTWRTHGTAAALWFTLGLLVVLVGTVFLSYRSALHGRLSKSSLILQTREKGTKAVTAALQNRVGQRGVAATPLRPAGTVALEGERLSAASEGDFIEKGTPVEVTGTRGDHLIVRSLSGSPKAI